MSDPKSSDSSDANNSDSKSSSEAEATDPIQNPPQNPEVSQSNRDENADERVNSDPILSPDETVIIEMQELSSDESSQRRISNAANGVKFVYEFPDDIERSEVNQSKNQVQKRRNDSKNVQFSKKLKIDRLHNKDSKSKGKEKSKINRQSSTSERSQNGSSNEDGKNNESNSSKTMEIDDSRRHRLSAIPFRRLTKGKDSKTPTHAQTNGKTIAFKKLALPSLSSGALADVEDNADSQSNDDISDELEKYPQESTSGNSNTVSRNLFEDPEGASTKSDNGSSRVVSEPNTSFRPVGDKGAEVSSAAINESKLKSDAERRRKRRCFVCNKKLGLTVFPCRCEGLYCPQHRYDKEHDCKFDYKSMGAEEIRKNNPRIIGEKISKL